jgi:hypothetical protein
VLFEPGRGNFYLNFGNTSIWMTCSEGESQTEGYQNLLKKKKWLTLYCYGKKNVEVLKKLVEEAVEFSL